ncbi:hypothetical protein PIB30_028978 [Stylosanthes scabra]|uniref:Uncharacterized protein n=1 Tax=Stylosanthes scabra TaxID=79078 RepID=A0ABU6VC03_9FABA|nr:hypothetical protein [Stylosanthes scabra]
MCTRDFLRAIEHPNTNNHRYPAHPPIPSSNSPSIIIYYYLEYTIQAYNNNQYSITTQNLLTKPRTRVGTSHQRYPSLWALTTKLQNVLDHHLIHKDSRTCKMVKPISCRILGRGNELEYGLPMVCMCDRCKEDDKSFA